MGAWFIPIVVTLAGFLLSKATESWHLSSPKVPVTPDETKVRIWAGMVYDKKNSKKASLAGAQPEVALWDEHGDYLGRAAPKGGIPEGNFRDFSIKPKGGNNVRAAYLQVSAYKNDGLCISAIQITYPDETSSMLFGDLPVRHCGWPGYPSLTEFFVNGPGQPGYRPYCFWLDADDSYSPKTPWVIGQHTPKSVHFHIPDFNAHDDALTAYCDHPDLICKSSARMQGLPKIPDTFAIFKPPLVYDPNTTDLAGNEIRTTFLDPKHVTDAYVKNWPQSQKMRDANKRERGFGRHWRRKRRWTTASSLSSNRWALSHSSLPELGAEYVCGQDNFIGPHYASTYEGKFCNMDDHSLWDLCDDNITSNCFDMESQTLWGDAPIPTGNNETGQLLARGETPPFEMMKLDYRIDMNDGEGTMR